ncbi:RDD family protein [Leisingera sp. ANG-Vp]|uniref:RDD family protein n=1 Tax=Leisingera sp. ANG-Vp TaxID=1577896 RepID=UPI00057DE570|nr:RDD family protein [Leisingera sp. ANG-Vp]KIC18922.1 RDD domain-containing protein [Leisingera sp. ANG-Vp]
MKLRWRRNTKPKPPAGELVPPEGVPLKLEVAGLGVRLAAQITDIFLTLIAAICLLILVASLGFSAPETLTAIGSLMFFIIRVPYYVMAELAWNGQTLGKRLMKIKVISHDGKSLSTHALVLRNLMKEAEIFLPATLLLSLDAASPLASGLALGWIAAGLMVPLCNRHRQRLGDLMAGTHVIHQPVPVLLKDLAAQPVRPRAKQDGFVFLAHQLDHYGAFELQTLETLLHAQETGPGKSPRRNQGATIEAVVEKIRQKTGYANRVPAARRLEFLRAFYNAQRAHLEQRQLFGERRKDKHYATDDSQL